jgi:hypothetical protein
MRSIEVLQLPEHNQEGKILLGDIVAASKIAIGW